VNARRLGTPALCALALLAAGIAHAAALTPEQQALHVLNRLGYGPRPGDVAAVVAMGVGRYIEQQLAPERTPEPEQLRQRLAALDTLPMSAAALFDQYGPPAVRPVKDDPEARKAVERRARIITEQAGEARFLRALESPRQLEEVMVDFWFNHFNVYAGKGLDRIWSGNYEREAIRPYVLGRFRDLLGATAKHPAMLFYLDNWRSTAPGIVIGRGNNKAEGLNENYARELMELHTLGVDGGYTQADVVALARILTGWGFNRQLLARGTATPFYFDAQRHDFGDKVFLGRAVSGRGIAEGEWALDVLAAHPATARHVSFQLAQYFVADNPPLGLVDRMARRFLDTQGDMREVLRTLFSSPEFWDAANAGAKFKTPYHYVLSTLRAADVPVANFRPVFGVLAQLGMPLYGCPTPDGYKNTEAAWLNPDAMTRRINFATAVASGRLPLDRVPDPSDDRGMGGAPLQRAAEVPGRGSGSAAPGAVDPELLRRTLGNQFSAKTLDAIASAPPALRAAMILGSPEFMRF